MVLIVALAGQGAVMAMGLAPNWVLALVATAGAGFCSTYCGVSLQAAIQSDLPDAYRGRVMSLWIVVGFGTVAIGSLAIGGLAEWVGIGTALAIAGALGVLLQGAVILGGARR
jgi:MFS family permease